MAFFSLEGGNGDSFSGITIERVGRPYFSRFRQRRRNAHRIVTGRPAKLASIRMQIPNQYVTEDLDGEVLEVHRKGVVRIAQHTSETLVVLILLLLLCLPSGLFLTSASAQSAWVGPMPVQTGVANGRGGVGSADIAVDDEGNAMVVWSEDRGDDAGVWSNRFELDAGWKGAKQLEGGVGIGGLQIATNAQGNAIIVWEHDLDGEGGDARTVVQASYYSISTGWRPALTISNGNGDALQPQVAMDAAGSAIVVWSLWNGTESSIWSNRYVLGVRWETPQRIDTSNASEASNPKVAVDPAGDAIVVWSQWYGADDTTGIWASRYAGAVWGNPVEIGSGFYPQVVADAAGNAVAVWGQSNLTAGSSSIQSRRFTPGVGWSSARVIDAVANWGGQDILGVSGSIVAMNPAGDAFVVWNRDLNYGVGSQIMVVRSVRGSDWGTPVAIGRPVESRGPIPDVATDSMGNAIVVWSRYTGSVLPVVPPQVWASQYTVGVGWDSEQSIDLGTGLADNPHAVFDSKGDAVVIWNQRYGTRFHLWANTYVVGEGWRSATLVERSTGGVSAPQVVAYGNGNAIAVWSQGDGTRESVWSNVYLEGMGWRRATPIDASLNDEFNPQVGVDSGGNAMAVWQQWNGVRYGVWSSSFEASDGWNKPTQLDNGSESAFSPQIAVNELGDGIAIWQQWNGTDFNIWASRYDASVGWDDAVLLENKSGWASSPKIGMDRYGNAVAIWTHDDPSLWSIRSIWSSRYTVGVGWTLAEEVAPICSSEVQLAVDADGDAIMTWGGGWGEYVGIWTNQFEHKVGWSSPKQLDNTSDYYPPQIAVNGKGDAIVLWQSQVKWGWGEVWAARYSANNASGEWDPPRRIDPGEKSMEESPSVALALSGNAIAVWIRWGEVYPQIWYPQILSVSCATGDGWGSEITIWENPDHSSTVSAPQVAMDDVGNAMVIWSESDETASSIWSNSYVVSIAPPDLSNIYHDITFLRWVAVVNSVCVIVLASFVIILLWMRWNRSPREPAEFRNDLQSVNPHSPSNQVTNAQPAASNNTVLTNGLALERHWPTRAASGPVRLTAKERILLHLLHFARYADSSEVPPELTQERIAEAAGIERRHFTQYVHPLEEDELVRERTSRVRGAIQKRRVYVLTEEGVRRTLGVRDRVRSAMVRVQSASGVREVTVAEALLEARGSMSILDILRESIETGVVDLTRSDSAGRGPASVTVLDSSNGEEINLMR